VRDIIVVDLDGTLCNCEHRVHLAREKKWDEFHSLLSRDKINVGAAAAIIALAAAKLNPIIVTGRPEKFKEQTVEWLQRYHVAWFFSQIIMRPDNDFSPDAELKLRLVEPFKDQILLALEDRDRVVSAFRKAGIQTWQVQEGSY
jgi:phosphoglycolate phosphatase-like HAD superfamily hydrolase